MIADTYRWLEGVGDLPRDLVLLRYIDRFGLGVLGRPPGAGELKRMATAERVVKAYHERNRSDNWAAWARNNPEDAQLLVIGATQTQDDDEVINGQ